MTKTAQKQPRRDGLPATAFAIVGDGADPATWQLPHHSGVKRPAGAAVHKVDWELMAAAVTELSPRGRLGRPIVLSPGDVILAARHLAAHHVAAGRRMPDVLAALI